jgi:hypothetical protein
VPRRVGQGGRSFEEGREDRGRGLLNSERCLLGCASHNPCRQTKQTNQSSTLSSNPIHLDCDRLQQQLFSQPLSWAQFEAASVLNNSSTHMSIFYASIKTRGLLRIFRDICEMVAASPEISLDIALRGRANPRSLILITYTISSCICNFGNPRER